MNLVLQLNFHPKQQEKEKDPKARAALNITFTKIKWQIQQCSSFEDHKKTFDLSSISLQSQWTFEKIDTKSMTFLTPLLTSAVLLIHL